MFESKISVIIPAYNVEKYIERCIVSVIHQSYKNLEIIIVDDGSNDMTSSICDQLKQRDDRIHVIHISNSGVSVARNIGLEYATGDYISMIDSDDYIDSQMFVKMMNIMMKYNADVVVCGYNVINTNGDIIRKGTSTNECIEYDTNAAFTHINKVKFECWNKLYKREIIGNTRFKQGQTYEEIYFEHSILFKSHNIVYIDNPMYFYTEKREGGTLSKFSLGRLSIITEYPSLIEDLKSNNMYQGLYTIVHFALKHMIGNYWDMISFGVFEGKNEIYKITKSLYKEYKKYLHLQIKDKVILSLFCINPNLTYLLHAIRGKIYE